MSDNTNRFLNILKVSHELIELLQVPLYSKLHSGKTFNNHQLFNLVCLKTSLELDYRRFVEYLETSNIPTLIGLKRIPHFTTLQKFSARQKIEGLEALILESCGMAKRKCRNVGIDATGISLDCASKHYAQRIARPILKRDFLKLSMFMDLDNLMVLTQKMRRRARHDILDVRPMWNKIKHLSFRKVFGDKGYDADFFHGLVYKSGRKSVIFVRDHKIPLWRMRGVFRKMARRDARNHQKGKRSLTETINSSLKRCYGSALSSRTLHTQKIELLFRILTYNMERLTILRKKVLALLTIFSRKMSRGARMHLVLLHFLPLIFKE